MFYNNSISDARMTVGLRGNVKYFIINFIYSADFVLLYKSERSEPELFWRNPLDFDL